jgi:hypothetical protein
MPGLVSLILLSAFTVGSLTVLRAQALPNAVNRTEDLKTVVVATETKWESEIAVPPVTSVQLILFGKKQAAEGFGRRSGAS